MTATATAQVQAIWQQYFTAAPRAEEAAVADADAAAGGQAKEVQEVRPSATSAQPTLPINSGWSSPRWTSCWPREEAQLSCSPQAITDSVEEVV